MFSLTAEPGADLGIYPQREPVHASWLEQAAATAALSLGGVFPVSSCEAVVADMAQHAQELSTRSDDELRSRADALRRQFASQVQSDALVATSFSLIQEALLRTVKLQLSDQQITAGLIMFRGGLVDMEVGEGKTLACILPALTAALAGLPVHVICANDSLVRGNTLLFEPVYALLGVTMGEVLADSSIDSRRAAYRCGVTYCSARQVASDYLQDRELLGGKAGKLQMQVQRLRNGPGLLEQLRLRGLCFAVVDDAASLLIEESLAPLILSRRDPAAVSGQAPVEQVLARSTYPRFFQRYLHLCGAASGLKPLKSELRSTYGVQVRSVARRQPSLGQVQRGRVYSDQQSKLQAICECVSKQQALGRPVLVATCGETESAQLAGLLAAAGVSHRLADSLPEDDSMNVLGQAGGVAAVTLTSKFAVSGGDYCLTREARKLGGLCVIISGLQRSARQQQTIIQRSSRRDDPGSVVIMASVEDVPAFGRLPAWMRQWMLQGRQTSAWAFLKVVQKAQQRQQALARRRMLAANRQLDELLTFSGAAK